MAKIHRPRIFAIKGQFPPLVFYPMAPVTPRKRRATLPRTPVKKRRTQGSFVLQRKYANKFLTVRPLPYERKWRQVGCAPMTMTPGAVFSINPFYWIAQGTQQDQRVGLTLSDVNLFLTLKYTHWGTNAAAAGKFQDSYVRTIIFANPSKWHQGVENVPEVNTAGVGTVVTVGTVFMDSGNDRMTTSFLNKDYNKILYDTGPLRCTSPSGPAVAANTINGGQITRRFMVKLGDVRYNSNGTQSYLRDDEVYIWTMADAFGITGTAGTDLIGGWSMNYMLTYRDS